MPNDKEKIEAFFQEEMSTASEAFNRSRNALESVIRVVIERRVSGTNVVNEVLEQGEAGVIARLLIRNLEDFDQLKVVQDKQIAVEKYIKASQENQTSIPPETTRQEPQ